MSEQKTFVIAGGGMAGAKAVEALRAEGFDGRLVLAGAESELPYERPPMSKSYLAGDTGIADARVHDQAFYDEHDVELMLGTAATELDPTGRRLGLSDGTTLGYDRLLIATGAVPRRAGIEGADRDGVHVLRTVDDADALRAAIRDGGRVAVIGAGWIGSEVAATARGLGAEVTLIEHASTPLQHVLGDELGAYFAELHRSHGVELLTDARIVRIEDGPRVVLADGAAVECDAVVLGIGVTPATGLADTAHLHVDDGIVTDEHLRASASGVYAAGDAASVFHPRYGRHVRVEHWATAADHGTAAGRNMLDILEPFEKVPYFFSDQYDIGMEYLGLHGPDDRLVVRGSVHEPSFQAFWIAADGTLSAGMHVNEWDSTDAIRRLVEAGARVDPQRLADKDSALEAAEECLS